MYNPPNVSMLVSTNTLGQGNYACHSQINAVAMVNVGAVLNAIAYANAIAVTHGVAISFVVAVAAVFNSGIFPHSQTSLES